MAMSKITELTHEGIALSHGGDYQEAIKVFTQIINLGKDSSGYWNRAVAQAGLGAHEEAIADYLEAIALQIQGGNGRASVLAFFNLGCSYEASGRHEEALMAYTHYIDNHSSCTVFGDAYQTRGELLVKMGRHEEALADMERASELDTSEEDETAYLLRSAENKRMLLESIEQLDNGGGTVFVLTQEEV